MNILVDGRPFTATSAGISSFLRCSLFEWAKLCPYHLFVLVIPKQTDKTLSLSSKPSNIVVVEIKNAILKRLPSMITLSLVIPSICKKYGISLYYSPVPNLPVFLAKSIKTLVVVHDVVHIEMKSTMQLTNRIINNLFFTSSVRRADIIWTNSEYTKSRLLYYYPQLQSKVIFVGCSVDKEFFHRINIDEQEIGTIKNKYGIDGPFMLFVGSLEPRKNLPFILSLMPQLYNRFGIKLLIVGGSGWKNTMIFDIISSPSFPIQSVEFCGHISNSELAILYNMADTFVSASFAEGFGMPQLEALLCGCPVVTSNNTAMKEVAKGVRGAITVTGYDENTWLSTIYESITNKKEIDYEALKKYDWHLIMENLNNIINTLL